MHLDAYRDGDHFYAAFDLPGVDPDTIDCTVERNVLTVRAERRRPSGDGVELVAAERPMGTFTRRLFLGDTLDTDKLEAGYEHGVLTLRIPVAERAKPRRVTISANGEGRRQINA
jgi:HSP20 family protein